MSSHDAPKKNSDLIYRLRGLGMAGAILHIGAHPDDEDVGLMAYGARKLGIRIVYWSATRGEGGQNRLGPDTQEALGVYRTWESLAVRAVDGGEALFGPFYDFGYSKSGEETLSKWGGQQAVIKEIVRAIRLVQPQIVIGRWTGNPTTDGHGHHQAVGSVTLAAFEAAGDATQFPELQAQGLAAWRPDKLFYATGGDWQPGEEGGKFGIIRPEFEREGYVRINSGEFDPIANRTYQEQGWIGFNHHKTQAMGFIPDKEHFYYYYALSKSVVPVSSDLSAEGTTLSEDNKGSFYAGLDASLTGLAEYANNNSLVLREALEAIKVKVKVALAAYKTDDVLQAGGLLLEGVALLRALRMSLGETERALLRYLQRKQNDFEETAVSCLGLDLDCLADYVHVTPSQQFQVAARLWNPRQVPITAVHFFFRLPDGWQVQPVAPKEAKKNKTRLEAIYDMTVPAMADLACPYWLRTPREQYQYHWPEGEPSGRPFDPPLITLECRVTLGTHEITLRAPAIRREGFVGGFRELPVVVVPPISLQPKIRQEILQVRASEQQLALTAVAYSNTEGVGVEGILRLEAPPEWHVEPNEIQLALGKIGDSQTVKFKVTIPKNRPSGVYSLRYVVQCGGREYDVLLKPVRMSAPGLPRLPDASTCIKEQFITNPAVNQIHLIDTQFVPGLKYAYIQGATEDVLTAVSHFNLDFHLISDAEMGYIDLDQFDAIVVGPNAYLMRDELRKNAPRLPKYVAQGGTLIVQYQGYGYQKEEFVPYPFTYSQPHDRVTFEDAPVTILEPDHFLFHQPNEISAADFENWVHDRGMYFFGQWDKPYTPFLSCNDPGEAPKKGGLLLTSYGRGTYIYVAYSFFRQLPAGVPGAFRLFANILAVPAALILARAKFLKNVSLFAFMDEDQRQTVARILSERWEKDGVYLCHQGDEGDEMYIIVKGEVAIIKEIVGKADQVIYRAKAGEAIGEMQVLSKSARAAAMQVQGDIHLIVIEGAHFRALMHQHPDMSDRVIQMLVDKLAAAGQS
jgi:LmbE family N-acetylglucosaminyl deacetylase